MEKKNIALWFSIGGLILVICYIVLIISESQKPTIFLSSGIVAIISAILGVLLTVSVTSILLKKQSEAQKELLDKQSEKEEIKERNVKVFEKKQEIYHTFLGKFQEIIQDGEIKIGVRKEDGTIDLETDELKDLIFQLAYIQMHADTDKIKTILIHIAEITQTLNDFKEKREEDKNKGLEEFYTDLSIKLFKIVAVLKADLYPTQDKKIDDIEKNIPEAEMKEILKKFELYAEVKDTDKYEMLAYFLEELYKQIKAKGYKVDATDLKRQARQFYDENRECHIGIELEEEGMCLSLEITREDGFFYGIPKEGDCLEEEELRIKKAFPNTGANKYWIFRHLFNLKFNELDSPKFTELKNPRNRENFVTKLVEEIVEDVKRFKNHNIY